MKKILLVALAAGTAVMAIAPAEARQGCGPGFHRGLHGACRRNDRRAVEVVRAPRTGVFYPGRGYWSGGRYWHQRYRWHGGWRYR